MLAKSVQHSSTRRPLLTTLLSFPVLFPSHRPGRKAERQILHEFTVCSGSFSSTLRTFLPKLCRAAPPAGELPNARGGGSWPAPPTDGCPAVPGTESAPSRPTGRRHPESDRARAGGANLKGREEGRADGGKKLVGRSCAGGGGWGGGS